MQRGSRRATFWLNGSTATALLVLLVAVSLFATPPSPPSIAEFAPHAQQQIEDAPDEQAVTAGAVGEVERGSMIEEVDGPLVRVPATVVVEQEALGVPSALACVTWPDGSVTQMFDPQSPPCIASWDQAAGNGGRTWSGITGTEIRIASRGSGEASQAFVEFFNNQFQFYGRRIVLVPFDYLGAGQEAQKSMAEAVLGEDVFAGMSVAPAIGDEQTWRRTLANNEVISIDALTRVGARAEDLAQLAPYAWNFYPPTDVMLDYLAQFSCDALVGRPAQFGGLGVASTERSFAVLHRTQTGGVRPAAVEGWADAVARCDMPSVTIEVPRDDAARIGTIAQIAADGITTVVCVASSSICGTWMTDMVAVGHQPEWIVVGNTWQDLSWSPDPPSQTEHLFGLVPWNYQLASGAEPAAQALASQGVGHLYNDYIVNDDYHQFLLLASGIQMAGANLTPETFARGLLQTQFPNPGAGSAPSFQAAVDFSDGDFAMVGDVTLTWWDSQAPARYRPNFPRGTWCFLDGGRRFPGGTWNEGEPELFTPTCP